MLTGLQFEGLRGLELYPVVHGRARGASVCLVRAVARQVSLQVMCSRVVKESIPWPGVVDALPPGLLSRIEELVAWPSDSDDFDNVSYLERRDDAIENWHRELYDSDSC